MTTWILAGALLAAQANTTISGGVHDATGAAVQGALVVVRAASGADRQTVTGPDGRFVIETSGGGDVTLVVRAGGFKEDSRRVTDADRGRDLDVVLAVATLAETVTVTATRREQTVGDVPASISVLDSEQIRQSPAVVADDVLRQVPTFSLFRRTSSLSSHPTTQGVSLRGIGPSGVSRTLVLLDGVPFNDPFGGWVYWTRVPLGNTDRIEIVEGSSSSLYGNYAMGGVINIVPKRPSRRTIEFSPEYGNNNSRKFDVFASDVWGKLGVTVDGSVFDTDGFPIVVAGERGAVDNKATVVSRSLNLKLDYTPKPGVNGFLRAGIFREARDNAKATTVGNIGVEEANDTRWTSASAGVRMLLPDQSDLQARVFTDFETFHSNFLAVPTATPARSIGRLTLRQKVPTTGVGGSIQWSRTSWRRHDIQIGADTRWVDGESQEDGLDAATNGTTVNIKRVSGGTQQSVGAFVQDIITPLPKLAVTVSARVDHWRNYDAHNLESNYPSGTPTLNDKPTLPERADTTVSPRVGALYRVSDRLSAWGSFSTGFRAPTLNELYRQFQVGAVLTRANDQLGPERLKGGEVGVTVTPWPNVSVRTTWFDNRVESPVSNVTIATNTQQRQNLGLTRIWGVQNTVEYRVGPYWRASGGYLFDRATVEEYAPNPQLLASIVGNDLPQVPTHRGSVHAAYANPRYATISVGVQMVGRQFDDDQNTSTRVLPGYATVDFAVSRTIMRNVEAFFGVQNLFDKEYVVGTLPTTIGSPRLVNGGVRLRLVGR
ncbi:MAG: TonB-dependent receptor [Vicinamibacterales bacterium]